MGLVRIRTEIFVNGQWVDISLHVLDRQSLAISWGRRDYSSRVTHTKCSPLINNKGGRYSTRNPYSEYFGLLTQNTLIRQSVQLPDGTWEPLHHSEIPSWPKRWDLSGNDSYMPVQTAGILRRLGQGKKALKDPLRRHIEASGPLAYWPLTDGQTAREGTELVQGSQPMRAIGEAGSFYQGQPNWGKGSLAPWLEPVVELPDDTVGRITARVPRSAITSWSVDHHMIGGGEGAIPSLQVFDTGAGTDAEPTREWALLPDNSFDEIQLRTVDRGETTSSSALLGTVSNAGVGDGSPHMIRLTTLDNGAGATDWAVIVDGVTRISGTHAVQNRAANVITYRWNLQDQIIPGDTIPSEAMALGHITYWGANAPAAIDTWRAAQGHVRELAGRRIERLCAEQGVPLLVNGDLDTTPAMGPQKPGTFLDLLQSAVDVDGGALYESRDAVGLAYRTRASKYNQGM